MILKFIKTKMLPGFLAFTMLTTSFGLSAQAANDESAAIEENTSSSASTNTVLAGIAAIGLLAALNNHGNSSDKTSPKSTTPPASGSSGSTSGSSGSASGASTSSSEEAQAVSLLNQDRAAKGLPSLKVNSQLTKLAENYASDMIKRGYFSHYNPEGQSPFDRMNNAGISYKTAGENLAINTTVSAAEQAFMNSSGHRANILNSSYTEVGIGVVHSPSGSVYVVQEFIGK